MKNSKTYIHYTDKENLEVVFSYLIFNVASINKKYGKLNIFVRDFELCGVTNGKIYILSEMVEPHCYLTRIIDEQIKWIGLKEKEDYVFGYERLTIGMWGSITPLINQEIPELKEIEWLGSIITHHGNYVWHNSNPNEPKNNVLTFRENRLEGRPPKKYYQELLIKYFTYFDSDKLSFNPKVYEVDNYYVYFDLMEHDGKNGICRETLERYNKISC